jgi:hypothetical protein
VRHSVTPVRVQHRDAPAYRDVLVLTYRAGFVPARPAGTWLPQASEVAPNAA